MKLYAFILKKCYVRMVCYVLWAQGSMPEGMRAGVESGIVHPPLPTKAYIYGKP